MNLKNNYFIILMVKYYKIDNINIDKIISFHAPNKKYEIIEYNSNKMNVDCVKKKYPLMSIIIPKGQCIFTEIDMEMYKYKNITDTNTFYIVNPIDNTYVLFDSSKFYTGEGTKINIWDENIDTNTDIDTTFEPSEISFEEINMSHDLKKIMYLPIKIDYHTSVKVKNTYTKIDYTRLYEKYGNIVDDLIPFIENKELDENNRFIRMKHVQKILSKDVCYWIMNESDKQEWSDCVYTNYDICVSIEKIPGVLNFILYSCHFWFMEVMKIYNVQIPLNIVEMFIAKDDKRIRKKSSDDKLIILNIQLNETTIPIQYDNESILLNQGDMFVYNKKTIREKSNNYVLVIMIDLTL
jgi:hypothetical protein